MLRRCAAALLMLAGLSAMAPGALLVAAAYKLRDLAEIVNGEPLS